ncbi:MAG: hypothetical protein J3K34DRAFT_237829 [Monoraphidium minutum]|nr:MAG: hypothetical protein J3K34DRAFT_237829 [Monoraphidium minutum]
MARCAATLLALLLSLAAAPPRGAHAHPGPGFGLAKQQVNITIVEPDPPPPGRFGLTSAPVYKYSCPKVNGRQYVEVGRAATGAAPRGCFMMSRHSTHAPHVRTPRLGHAQWRAPLLDYESKPAGTFKMCWDLNKELLIWM